MCPLKMQAPSELSGDCLKLVANAFVSGGVEGVATLLNAVRGK
jgi:hypothetical protein